MIMGLVHAEIIGIQILKWHLIPPGANVCMVFCP